MTSAQGLFEAIRAEAMRQAFGARNTAVSSAKAPGLQPA